jgi:hypothetical protein
MLVVQQMVTCARCDALLGEAVTVDPHGGLRGGPVYVTLEGVLERYRCGACGAAWERLRRRSKDADGCNAHVWAMLKASRAAARRQIPPRPASARLMNVPTAAE